MRRLLIIEDGDEYEQFVRALFAEELHCTVAHGGGEALLHAALAEVFLVDLRFDRVEPGFLFGDVEETSRELFGGDRKRALRHLHDQQGIYILRALREAGHLQRAIFVHDFAPARLIQLRRMYGDVVAIGAFDQAALRALLGPA